MWPLKGGLLLTPLPYHSEISQFYTFLHERALLHPVCYPALVLPFSASVTFEIFFFFFFLFFALRKRLYVTAAILSIVDDFLPLIPCVYKELKLSCCLFSCLFTLFYWT